MGRVRGAVVLACVALLCALLASVASAHSPKHRKPAFRPRIGGALGIVPPVGRQGPPVPGTEALPLVYHGGIVMHGVTIHTVFWAPAGYSFGGAPTPSVLPYQRLMEQFFTDVAHDSGTSSNVFSILRQFGDASGPGTYSISYSAPTDSISDGEPYPGQSAQCVSPAGLPTCVTDVSIQHELARIIPTTNPTAIGLHDLWLVFLPPNVDTCAMPGACGTDAYAGYHSIANLGSGLAVYAVGVDPLIGGGTAPGFDPQGNPDAEFAINVAAHETMESISDPQGTGWYDQAGGEIGDKCQAALGTPLGYATDGSPYNQLIDGDQYFFQAMWSNAASGCVQQSSVTSSPPPPPTVSLQQFSPTISGTAGIARAGLPVTVALQRGSGTVAIAHATTDAGGGWTVVLRSRRSKALEAVGDDRDSLMISYGKNGPPPEEIDTGAGSSESEGALTGGAGFTGWAALDAGFQVNSRSVLLAPCLQAGVLGLSVDGVPAGDPVATCSIANDAAVVPTRKLGPATTIEMTSLDNRVQASMNDPGALVRLAVRLGEPGSMPSFNQEAGAGSSNSGAASGPAFPGSGLPSCLADLSTQKVSCSGLVPGARYFVTRRRGRAVLRVKAGGDGVANLRAFSGHRSIRGGDVLTLRNEVRRVLSVLHVARLRIDVNANDITGGSCQPLKYWQVSLDGLPPGSLTFLGGYPGASASELFGAIVCPPGGNPKGLPVTDGVAQTDDLSGGETQAELPRVVSTTPLNGELVYGRFDALARISFAGSSNARMSVNLVIRRAGSSRPVFSATNVNTLQGVQVTGLPVGAYVAKWRVVDVNGDTRTLQTRFVEEG